MNVDRCLNTLRQITDKPRGHEQDVWARSRFGRRTMCYAGHAVVMAGCALKWEPTGWFTKEALRCVVPAGHELVDGGASREMWIFQAAQKWLGLTSWQACFLFAGHLTREELDKTIRGFAQTQRRREEIERLARDSIGSWLTGQVQAGLHPGHAVNAVELVAV